MYVTQLRTASRSVWICPPVCRGGVESFLGMNPEFLGALGGEDGCRRLSAEFYARVGQDQVLRPLFPGKSLRCATEAFAAFLIQFLGGDEEQTQHRWYLSLRESHARSQRSEEHT